MPAGPLRQGVAVLGLLALTPTMVLLATGRLSADAAAIRAAITFALVVVVGRTLAMMLRYYARLTERSQARERARDDRRLGTEHA